MHPICTSIYIASTNFFLLDFNSFHWTKFNFFFHLLLSTLPWFLFQWYYCAWDRDEKRGKKFNQANKIFSLQFNLQIIFSSLNITVNFNWKLSINKTHYHLVFILLFWTPFSWKKNFTSSHQHFARLNLNTSKLFIKTRTGKKSSNKANNR